MILQSFHENSNSWSHLSQYPKGKLSPFLKAIDSYVHSSLFLLWMMISNLHRRLENSVRNPVLCHLPSLTTLTQPVLCHFSHHSQTAWVLTCSSHGWLSATPWTVACKAPPSIGLSRQEYWSGLPCPPPGDAPDPGIDPSSPASPAFQSDYLSSDPPGKVLFSDCFKANSSPWHTLPVNNVVWLSKYIRNLVFNITTYHRLLSIIIYPCSKLSIILSLKRILP